MNLGLFTSISRKDNVDGRRGDVTVVAGEMMLMTGEVVVAAGEMVLMAKWCRWLER